tara:strand:- start:11519 stop:11698 length:180 start_codon:yes stop_codon:yes gene_type:complete
MCVATGATPPPKTQTNTPAGAVQGIFAKQRQLKKDKRKDWATAQLPLRTNPGQLSSLTI